MAITLYRCSECGSLVGAIYGSGPSQVCRSCKLGGSPDSTIGGSPEKIRDTSEITVVEAVADAFKKWASRDPVTADGGKSLWVPSSYGAEEIGRQIFIESGQVYGYTFPDGSWQQVTNDKSGWCLVVLNGDGSIKDAGDLIVLSGRNDPPTPEVPAVSDVDPHAAMLNPKRKIRLQK